MGWHVRKKKEKWPLWPHAHPGPTHVMVTARFADRDHGSGGVKGAICGHMASKWASEVSFLTRSQLLLLGPREQVARRAMTAAGTARSS